MQWDEVLMIQQSESCWLWQVAQIASFDSGLKRPNRWCPPPLSTGTRTRFVCRCSASFNFDHCICKVEKIALSSRGLQSDAKALFK